MPGTLFLRPWEPITMAGYLLPCGCGADIVVTTAKAGGIVTCPACGGESQVPKLRDLSALRPAASTVRSRSTMGAREWTAAHTMLLAGTLIAAACGLGSVALVPPEVKFLDSRAIRDSVMSVPTDEVLSRFRERLAISGIERPPTIDEARSIARSDFYVFLRDSLRVGAAAGALVALLGGAWILLRRGRAATGAGA